MILRNCLINIKAKYFSSDFIDCPDKGHKIANLFSALALIFGIILIYLNPPMVCPDENAHYMLICRITGGSMFVDVQDGAVGSFITQDQAEFINYYNGRYAGLDAPNYTFSDVYFLSHLNYTGNQKIFYASGLSAINPMSYIVQSTGVFIAQKLFHVTSPYNMLIWAKFANLLFFIVVTRVAIIKTPVLRNTMFLVALMPMTIYQCSSASYDCALIACSLLLFAYTLKLILASEEYRVTLEDIFAVCFSCAFIFASKIAYALLAILLFAVSYKKFGSVKKYIACISLIVTMGIIFYLIPTAITAYFTSAVTDTTVTTVVAQQEEYILSHLHLLPGIIINTTLNTFSFWTTGFFGILGGLDINFPQPFIYFYLFLLLISAITELSVIDRIGILLRILSFVGVGVFFIGTAYAMYVSWTPLVTGEVGGDYFTGIQGRYFIPVVLFVFLIFANPMLKKFKFTNKILDVQMSVSKCTVIGYLCLTCLMLLTKIWI